MASEGRSVISKMSPGKPSPNRRPHTSHGQREGTARLTGGTLWKVGWIVPRLGYALAWLRAPAVHWFSVVAAPALLCAIWLRRIWARDATDRDPGDALRPDGAVRATL